MTMLLSLIPSGLWVLTLISIAFGVMFRIFATRVLFVFILIMIFLPVAGPLVFGLMSDFFRILSLAF